MANEDRTLRQQHLREMALVRQTCEPIGDGKIFVSRIDEAIRIRKAEPGETAL